MGRAFFGPAYSGLSAAARQLTAIAGSPPQRVSLCITSMGRGEAVSDGWSPAPVESYSGLSPWV